MDSMVLRGVLGLGCDWLCTGLVLNSTSSMQRVTHVALWSDLRTQVSACAQGWRWGLCLVFLTSKKAGPHSLAMTKPSLPPPRPRSLKYPDPIKQALHDNTKILLSRCYTAACCGLAIDTPVPLLRIIPSGHRLGYYFTLCLGRGGSTGRWFRRVEEGAELFMRNWHETERRKAAERRAKAAAAPSTVGISKRPGGGGRGMLFYPCAQI